MSQKIIIIWGVGILVLIIFVTLIASIVVDRVY